MFTSGKYQTDLCVINNENETKLIFSLLNNKSTAAEIIWLLSKFIKVCDAIDLLDPPPQMACLDESRGKALIRLSPPVTLQLHRHLKVITWDFLICFCTLDTPCIFLHKCFFSFNDPSWWMIILSAENESSIILSNAFTKKIKCCQALLLAVW